LRGRRGRIAGSAAARAGPGRAHSRNSRSARQCHAANGRQCQRADRLPHLSAYRPVRTRLAGRRTARARDARQSKAEDRHRGPAVAEECMDYCWETRDYESFKLLSVAEAVAKAKAGKPGDKPLIVADYTDNPGGGGYGDATAFLKGLVEGGVEPVAFHAICDPEAVAQGMRAGI